MVFLLALFAPACCPATGALAQEQPGACFDVIANANDSGPAGAILLNRCNGQTWLLVRTYQPAGKGAPPQFVYRWSALPADIGESRQTTAPPAARNDKCFAFQGRQFCE
jgi:hypothetical protein